MRFLIVDDDPKKIAVIRACLEDEGVVGGDILIAEHAAEARVLLEKGSIDVLLIDVLLPVRRGAPPKGENSIELLRQIVEDGTTTSPGRIFGITADKDALAEYEDEFRSLVTQVLHVAPGEDDWRESLRALLLMLRRIDDARDVYDYDICVLNALRVPELEAVYDSWPVELGDEQLLGRNVIYRIGTVNLGGSNKRIVCAHLSQMGPVASTHASTLLLNMFRPRIMLMTGICGGFSDQVKVGDVLVADVSWDWQAGKWSDEGTLATALDQRKGAAELMAVAQGLAHIPKMIHAEYSGVRPVAEPQLVIGPMVTGSSVVASLDIQKVFRKQHRKMMGVDMECYGLYYAVENHAGAPVRAFCVKAVSDLADRAKEDDFQRYCSHLSARVALEVARRYLSQ